MLTACCSRCQSEITIFDSRRHGYDAIVDTEERSQIPFADEKGLVDVIVRDVTLKANTIMPQYYNVDVPLHKDAAVVKAFIFDGVDTIKPLTPCIIK